MNPTCPGADDAAAVVEDAGVETCGALTALRQDVQQRRLPANKQVPRDDGMKVSGDTYRQQRRESRNAVRSPRSAGPWPGRSAASSSCRRRKYTRERINYHADVGQQLAIIFGCTHFNHNSRTRGATSIKKSSPRSSARYVSPVVSPGAAWAHDGQQTARH